MSNSPRPRSIFSRKKTVSNDVFFTRKLPTPLPQPVPFPNSLYKRNQASPFSFKRKLIFTTSNCQVALSLFLGPGQCLPPSTPCHPVPLATPFFHLIQSRPNWIGETSCAFPEFLFCASSSFSRFLRTDFAVALRRFCPLHVIKSRFKLRPH